MKYTPMIGLLLLALACGQRNKEPKNNLDDFHQNLDREALIQMNKRYLKAENQAIEEYVKEHNWNYIVHSNGVYYRVLNRGGQGKRAKEGDVVVFRTTMELLNGKRIYADAPQRRILRIDREDAEIGLHEMLKLFGPGDSVQMVLPSYLAFGLAGDLDEVGVRQPVVYAIKIEQIKTQ